MFVELMPLLAGRTVMITVARVDDRTLRVNVIPTKTNENENVALTTPLSPDPALRIRAAARRRREMKRRMVMSPNRRSKKYGSGRVR